MRLLFLFIGLFLFNGFLFAHGISQADKQVILNGGNIEYMWLGAIHMLTGYDHLLFLFGVIFFLNNFKDVVKFVTIFTLGHSVTLIFATFYGLTINYYLIDAVIALSVMYKGFDNLKGFERYLDIKSPNLMIMVLIFGLIHGFGLSTRLQQLPLGEDKLDIFFRIVSFNIGVELGQVFALILMLVVLKILRNLKSFIVFSKVTNFILIFLGFLLFLIQLHGYIHLQNQEEFGFNADEHYHIHMKMKENKTNTKEHSHGGSTHIHEKISQTKALVLAKNRVDELSKNGTINKTWKYIDASKIKKIMNKDKEKWIITFHNPKLDKSQQNLYIFIDLYGEVLAANYSGK